MAFHPVYGIAGYPDGGMRYPEPSLRQPFFHHNHSYDYKPVGHKYHHHGPDPRRAMPHYNVYVEREMPIPPTFNMPPPNLRGGAMYRGSEPIWSPDMHRYPPAPTHRYSHGRSNRSSYDQNMTYSRGRAFERVEPSGVPTPTRTNSPLSIMAPSTMRTASWTGSQSIRSSSRMSNDGSYESRARSSLPPSRDGGSPPSYHSEDFGLSKLSLGRASGYESMDGGYAASESSVGQESDFDGPSREEHRNRVGSQRPRYAESDHLSVAVDRGSPRSFTGSRAGSDFSGGGSVYSEFYQEDRHDGFSDYERYRSDEVYDSDDLYSEDGYYSHYDEDRIHDWD